MEKENTNTTKTKLQNDFWPEHAEDISYVYVAFKYWVCFWLTCKTNIKKDKPPVYGIVFVCIFSCSVDTRLLIYVFLSIKWRRKKNASHIWTYYWKHTCFFFFCLALNIFWQIISILKQIVWETQKWLSLSRSSGSWVIDQNVQDIVLINTYSK